MWDADTCIAQARKVLSKGTKAELEDALRDLVYAAEAMRRRLNEAEPLMAAVETVARRIAEDRIESEFGSRL